MQHSERRSYPPQRRLLPRLFEPNHTHSPCLGFVLSELVATLDLESPIELRTLDIGATDECKKNVGVVSRSHSLTHPPLLFGQ